MQTYKIIVREVLERIVSVEAESAEQAEAIVSQQYHNEEIVLDYSDFNGVEICHEN